MSVAAERKALFAKRYLVDRLMSIANSKGTSLYNLVNEIFEAYIKLNEAGVNVQEVVDKLLYYSRIQNAGFILAPGELCIRYIKEACSNNQETCRSEWFKAGTRIARFYKTLILEDSLAVLMKDLELAMNWLGEVTVKSSSSAEDTLEVMIAGPLVAGGLEQLGLELFKGILLEFNYELTHTNTSPGVIKAVFRRRVKE